MIDTELNRVLLKYTPAVMVMVMTKMNTMI